MRTTDGIENEQPRQKGETAEMNEGDWCRHFTCQEAGIEMAR